MQIRFLLLFSLYFIVGVWNANFNKTQGAVNQDQEILYYEVDPASQDLRMFWKDSAQQVFGNFSNLNSYVNSLGKELVFAMNGGMYMEDQSPLGLYIEEGVIYKNVNRTQKGYGNFYMQPNGIFAIDNNGKSIVMQSVHFKNRKDIRFATQSGPMLVIEGNLHPKFMKGSKNLNIRNGVGILPNGKVLFAMSKQKINFYDFALFFKTKGCKNALYLDGFVSRTYLPEKGYKKSYGSFGVMIGEVK